MRTRALLHCSVSPPTHHIRSSTPHRPTGQRKDIPRNRGRRACPPRRGGLRNWGQVEPRSSNPPPIHGTQQDPITPSKLPATLGFQGGRPTCLQQPCAPSHAASSICQPPQPTASMDPSLSSATSSPFTPTATLPPACSPPSPALNAMWILHIWRLASIKTVSPASTSGDWPI